MEKIDDRISQTYRSCRKLILSSYTDKEYVEKVINGHTVKWAYMKRTGPYTPDEFLVIVDDGYALYSRFVFKEPSIKFFNAIGESEIADIEKIHKMSDELEKKKAALKGDIMSRIAHHVKERKPEKT